MGGGNAGQVQNADSAGIRISEQRGTKDLDVLVGRCRARDATAWERLIRLYSPVVWTVVRSHGLSHADSEDVYQFTWQRLVEHIGSLKQPGRVAAWLVTVAKREAVNRSRQSRRVLSVSDPAELSVAATLTASSPEEQALAQVDSTRLWAAIRSLPDEHQVLLALLFAEPALSYDDIAAASGMARGSIGPTRRRILATIRARLKANTDPDQ
ncbi:sigma-70 family RNA polymerase sigma factor [Streptomyces sp. BHT-5-2]|uniref:RNA polymerase sigma factor n=1 Tax=unclassified Streptomyces TaxID=2593676 RepID=UPI001C8D3BF8|nr:sigma-70 family RNA polymerase sigma factor [Streptomyces sp. BHT-5-2]QZL04585.1 sigma-70 family RNA polymerase sigma factor [Streptomyces sp. BHT-5-2]